MTYLLDVNALLALGFENHAFNGRAAAWLRRTPAARVATCSIVELGFVRVLCQAPAYSVSALEAKAMLLAAKQREKLHFLEDRNDVRSLPDWVIHPRQITDGHLAALARTHHAALATFDERIPDAFQIP